MHDIIMIEFYDLQRNYDTCRDAHAEGKISNAAYMLGFKEFMELHRDLNCRCSKIIDLFIMRDVGIQTMKEDHTLYLDFVVQWYLYLQKHYASMKAIFEEKTAAYKDGDMPEDLLTNL